MLTLALSLALVAGCPRQAPPLDYTTPPRLPSPEAGAYGRYATTPADPVVASVLGDHTWDAYLSGAAAGIALAEITGDTSIDSWQIRETLWRAGYAYPIDDARVFRGEPEGPPPPDVAAWLAEVDPAADLGLVRARNALGQTWVGLTARPRLDVGTPARVWSTGDTLTLPAIPGAKWTVSDPDGSARSGPLDGGEALPLDVDGEWVVQVNDAQGIAAWFTVYVDLPPPKVDLLPPAPAAWDDADEAEEVLIDLLHLARDAYDLPRWTSDPILDGAAQQLLDSGVEAAPDLLSSMGVPPPHVAWSCKGRSPEACVERWVWSPKQREALLSTAVTHLGVAVATEADKVRIRVVLSGG